MSIAVKLYGGPLHGQTFAADENASRIDCYDKRFRAGLRLRDMYNPDLPIRPMDWDMDRRTYEINIYQERRGDFFKRMKVGILEGTAILDHERWEIERDMEKVRWEPIREFSILEDFELWFAWTAYKYTGREKVLYDSLYGRPTSWV